MLPAEILIEGQSAFFADPPDYKRAKDCFLSVTASAPDWVEGHHWLASASESLAEFGLATKSYRKAIQCDPMDSRPRIALGRLLISKGHLEQAIIELKKGIELKPHYGEADARLFLAEAYLKAKCLSKAREQWTAVERMEPFYPSGDMPMHEARKMLSRYPKC